MKKWQSILINYKQTQEDYLSQNEFSFLEAISVLLKEGFTLYQSNLLLHYSLDEGIHQFGDFSIVSINGHCGFFLLTQAGVLFGVKGKDVNN